MEIEHGTEGHRAEPRHTSSAHEPRCDPLRSGSGRAERSPDHPPATQCARFRRHHRHFAAHLLHDARARHARRGARGARTRHAVGRSAMAPRHSSRHIRASCRGLGPGSFCLRVTRPRWSHFEAPCIRTLTGLPRRAARTASPFFLLQKGDARGAGGRAQLRPGHRWRGCFFDGDGRGVRSGPAPTRTVVLSQSLLGDRGHRPSAISGSRSRGCACHGSGRSSTTQFTECSGSETRAFNRSITSPWAHPWRTLALRGSAESDA